VDAEDAAQAPDPVGQARYPFDLGEPERHRKDVPSAQVYVLEAGHFALDTQADEIAKPVSQFMKSQK